MKILVIGSSSFIGRHLSRSLGYVPGYSPVYSPGYGPGHEVYCTFRTRPPEDDANHWYRLELTDSMALEKLFSLIRPEVVVHLAAMADVRTAERERDLATAVNVTATEGLVDLCLGTGARLLFVSTEYVFDGRQGPYREDDLPGPTTHYGKTKLDAEYAVARLGSRGAILRTSIVYGWPAPGGRNFVPHLVERLRRREACIASPDVMRSPIYVERLVDSIAKLAQDFQPGIHHVAGRDWLSMHDFSLAVADAFGLDRNLVTTTATETASPDRLGLDCTKTIRLLGVEQAGLAEGLAAMRASPRNPWK